MSTCAALPLLPLVKTCKQPLRPCRLLCSARIAAHQACATAGFSCCAGPYALARTWPLAACSCAAEACWIGLAGRASSTRRLQSRQELLLPLPLPLPLLRVLLLLLLLLPSAACQLSRFRWLRAMRGCVWQHAELLTGPHTLSCCRCNALCYHPCLAMLSAGHHRVRHWGSSRGLPTNC